MEPQPSNENHFDNIYYSKRKSEPFDGFKWPWNEKKEPKKLREKHYADARADIEQKPYCASSSSPWRR